MTTDIKKRLYIIDDEEGQRTTLREIFDNGKWDITLFHSVDEAWNHMALSSPQPTNLPDVVITDYDTASTNHGLQLAGALRGKGVGAVLHSAHEGLSAEVLAKENPQASYVKKVATIAQIRTAVNDTMGKVLLLQQCFESNSAGRH